MDYLKKYSILDEQIEELKKLYNDSIIDFLSENQIFVEETISYLQSENFNFIYEMLSNNIKIFLETKVALQEKIEKMKLQKLSYKVIQMILIDEELYSKI